MAWSKCDYLDAFIGKKIKSIEMNYGEGRLIIHFENGEMHIDAIIDKSQIAQLKINYQVTTDDEIII